MRDFYLPVSLGKFKKVMRIYISVFLLFPTVTYAEPLFYFNVGAKWTYLIDGPTRSTVTNTITEVKSMNGKSWYKLLEYGEIFWVTNTEIGQVEAVNFFGEEYLTKDEIEESLVFKYPAKIGESWNNLASKTTYEGGKTVTVPAGTFDCHGYIIDMGSGDYSYSCIAKGIGIVYNESILDGGVKEVSKLIKYEK